MKQDTPRTDAPDRRLLSSKPIPPRERLIFALDVPSAQEAREIVEKLGDSVLFYKIGLQLFMAGGYFELLEWLKARGKKVFADLKFYDVPQTVKSAVLALKGRDIEFVTVHGNDKILKAAAENKNNLKILAVTVLTSLDANDLRQMGYQGTVEDLVLSRAKQAMELGCDGIIASGLEVARIREELGEKLIVVCP
ncbi:MAG: orotidine-5'-phosphate decarboxylase, partial [bacterium]